MSTQEYGSFTVELDEASVRLYTDMATARQTEAAAWLEVTTALTKYVERNISVWESGELEDMRSTYLPDLFDQIVAEIQDAEDPAKNREVS